MGKKIIEFELLRKTDGELEERLAAQRNASEESEEKIQGLKKQLDLAARTIAHSVTLLNDHLPTCLRVTAGHGEVQTQEK